MAILKVDYGTLKNGGDLIGYTEPLYSISSVNSSYNFPEMKGRRIIVLLFYHTGSATAYDRLDGATCSGGTITKLCNLRNTSATAYGTFYNLEITSDICTVTAPYNCFMHSFEASIE